MSASATRDGLSLIAVVLGCKTGTERFKDCATLLDYGFANYKYQLLSSPDEISKEIEVKGGMQKSIELSYNINGGFVLPKGSENSLEYKITLPEYLEAPVKKGDKIGKVTYTTGKEELASFDIIAKNETEEINFGSVFNLLYNALIAL